jgi:glycosyltransferase involved in cell wall biosynthesis
MPIDWPEPFGLNMIESMACGTPTVAFRHGSVPEIIVDGVNGFIVDNVDQAAEAVLRAKKLSRPDCRRLFEERFTASRMAADYLRLYEAQLAERAPLAEISTEMLASLQDGMAS